MKTNTEELKKLTELLEEHKEFNNEDIFEYVENNKELLKKINSAIEQEINSEEYRELAIVFLDMEELKKYLESIRNDIYEEITDREQYFYYNLETGIMLKIQY